MSQHRCACPSRPRTRPLGSFVTHASIIRVLVCVEAWGFQRAEKSSSQMHLELDSERREQPRWTGGRRAGCHVLAVSVLLPSACVARCRSGYPNVARCAPQWLPRVFAHADEHGDKATASNLTSSLVPSDEATTTWQQYTQQVGDVFSFLSALHRRGLTCPATESLLHTYFPSL